MERFIYILGLVLFPILCYPNNDTVKITFSLKEHTDNAFDYNTLHYRWAFIRTKDDSIKVIQYQLDNYKKPFTNKYEFKKDFMISQTLFDTIIFRLDKIIKLNDLEYYGIKNPPKPYYNCFATPPKISGRIEIDQHHNQEKKNYFFDLEREDAVAEIERIQNVLLLLN